MKPQGTPVLISTAAQRVGVGERTVRRWITARMLTSYKTQTGVRVVMLQDVIALEASVRRAATAGPRARLRRDHFESLVELAKQVADQAA